jgi:VWFA-related protein
MREIAIAAAVLLVLGSPEPPASAQAPPVFPATVERVAIDVTVVDGRGRPVSDLRPEDFEVLVDGRPRKVVSAQFLRHAAETPEAPALPAAATPKNPPFSTNADPPGRLIVLVPDVFNLSVGGARGAAEAAKRFLERLTPADRVALVTLPTGPRVDFTSDHAKLREALGKVMGGSLDRVRGMRYISMAEAFASRSRSDRRLWNGAINRECSGVRSQSELGQCISEMENEANQIYTAAKSNTATSITALRGLMRALGSIEGPKTVVLLSQGLVTGGSMGEPGADRELAPVAEDAARARVTLYTILIDRAFLDLINVSEREAPATPVQDRRLLADGLEAVTGYAGGQLYRVTVLADPGFERIAAETSAAWLLSIEPEAGDRDGKPHGLRVKVARDKTRTHARPQFVAAPAAAQPLTSAQRARQALEAPLGVVALPVAVTTYALGQVEGEDIELALAVEVGLEPAAPGLVLIWRATDEAGAVVGGEVVEGPLKPVNWAGGAYYSASLAVKPGSYLISVAVADATGRVGSVQHRDRAEFTPAGDLALSDLMLAEPERRAGGRAALNVDGRVRGRTLTAYLELRARQGGDGASPTVRFEIAPGTAPGAEPTLRQEATVQAEAAPGRFAAQATLDLAGLAPGPYLIRAVVGRQAYDVGRPLQLVPGP